jgi:DNA-binding SARP family transcriptional activator
LSAAYIDRIDTLAATASEAVYRKTKDKRVIVLYPKHRQHSTLISLLHKHYSDRLYYFTLSKTEDRDVKSFLRSLSNDAMFPIDFGENLRAALHGSSNASDWGTALAQDLSNMNTDENFIVLIDNFEYVGRDDVSVQGFFDSLSRNLAQNVQVVVNGRELRRQQWAELISSGKVIALGDDETLGDGLFRAPELQGQLEVYALAGGSRVLVDGRPVTAWEGSLPRNMFYFFIDKPMVTRSEVFEAFWPDLQTKEATNVFHVTKRKISEKIGYDVTAFENSFYVPNKRLNRLYDVAYFEHYVDEAIKANDENIAEENWLKAIEIYRGQFLKEVEMDWASQRREQLRDVYAQSLISVARIYSDQGRPERALGFYIRATGERPDREDVYREIMSIYGEQGRIDDVAAQYQLLEERLKERLDIAPSQETRQLYEQLTRG